MKKKPEHDSASTVTVRASEIGSYLYCQRAWWYQRQGQTQARTEAQESGLAWHRRHGRRILTAAVLRTAGWALIVIATAVAAGALAEALLR